MGTIGVCNAATRHLHHKGRVVDNKSIAQMANKTKSLATKTMEGQESYFGNGVRLGVSLFWAKSN